MTEQVATEAVEPVETVEPIEPTFSNPLATGTYREVVNLSAEYNQTAETLRSANVKMAEVQEVLETSDDEKVAEFRSNLEKLSEAVKTLRGNAQTYIRENILKSETLSDEDRAKTVETLKKLRHDISNAIDFGTTLAEREGKSFTDGLPSLKGVSGARGGTSGVRSGQGAGVARMRLAGVTVDGTTFKTFTLAKSVIGAEVPEIHKAYYAAAGVDNWKNAPDSVSFELNGHSITVEKDNEDS